jgi:hypothetical protein
MPASGLAPLPDAIVSELIPAYEPGSIREVRQLTEIAGGPSAVRWCRRRRLKVNAELNRQLGAANLPWVNHAFAEKWGSPA